MNHFEPRGGQLFCEEVALEEIAREVGTPVYIYSSATLARHYQVFRQALDGEPALAGALIAFAVKANSNLSVLASLARLGAGADTVSEGEIRRALSAGIGPAKIIFSGVGKTAREIAFAIAAGVRQINIESEPELALVAELAEAAGARPSIAIRVNPPRSPPAPSRASLGSLWPRPNGSMRQRRPRPTSTPGASPATSAARSPILRPSRRPMTACGA